MAARHDDNLELHGKQWRVVVRVPRHLRAIIGKSVLKKGLGTDSRSEAQLRRWAVLKDLKAIIAEAETKAKSAPLDPVLASALDARIDRDILRGVAEKEERPGDIDTLGMFDEILASRAESIAKSHHPAKAREYVAIAKGERTPLTAHVAQWLADVEGSIAKRTAKHYRDTVNNLAAYAGQEGLPQTIEAFDRRAAGDLISDRFIAPRVPYKTARKYVSALSSYWRWLSAKGKLPEGASNPWRDQVMPPKDTKRRGGNGNRKMRAFTDAEVARLLYEGEPDDVLREFMLIAALSGMRIEEIGSLQARDFDAKAKTITIREAKTDAGVRLVPIHTKLEVIIRRRIEGKASGDWLFPELPEYPPESLSERSMTITKRFVTYRRGLGVDERVEGRRNSLVNFHSFRRWFITKAERAGIPKSTVSFVVGHEEGREGMTFGVYSAGPSLEQLRKCVQAVKLPKRNENGPR